MTHPARPQRWVPLGPPPAPLTLPGLTPPASCVTPAMRRRWLAERTPAQVRALLQPWLTQLRAVDPAPLARLAAWLRAPEGEVVASPFGLRACALGAAVGALVVRHELRTLVPWADDLRGEDGALDVDHGSWARGVLHAGRYQSFQLDGAFATFNPNHSARWTPHELLHRAVGFGWASGPSRWEVYQWARLAELLPVVHWFGTDLVARLRERGFDTTRDATAPHAHRAEAVWLGADEAAAAAHVDATATWLLSSVAHFDAELRASAAEAASGTPVAAEPAPPPPDDAASSEADAWRRALDPVRGLNSHSDAVAYVSGHFGRLSSARVDALLSACAPRPVATTTTGLLSRVEATFDALLFGPLTVNPALVHARAHGRLLYDVAHRVVHAERRWPAAAPSTEDLGAACAAAWEGDCAPAQETLLALWRRLPDGVREEAFAVGMPLCAPPAPASDARDAADAADGADAGGAPGPAAHALTSGSPAGERGGEPQALALMGAPPVGLDVQQLAAGVQSATPGLWAWLDAHGRTGALVSALVSTPSRGPLVSRLASALRRARDESTPWPHGGDEVAEALLTFETAVLAATVRDDVAERLSATTTAPLGPDLEAVLAGGRLLASAAFARLELPFDAAELAWALVEGEAWPPLDDPGVWLVGNRAGDVVVVRLSPQMDRLWRALPCPAEDAASLLVARAGEPDELGPGEWFAELLDASAVAWLPAAR